LRSQQQLARDDEYQQCHDARNKRATPVEGELGHVANRGDKAVTRP